MDDQAHQLRQLVQAFRQAAEVSTGPPLLLVATAAGDEQVTQFADRLIQAAAVRGVAIAATASSVNQPAPCDWQLSLLAGEYQIADAESWQRASLCILITASDDESIVGSYKLLKQASLATPLPSTELVVVSGGHAIRAEAALERFQQTCENFLSLTVTHATAIDTIDDFGALHVEMLVERLAMLAPLSSVNVNTPLALNPSQ